LVEAIRVTGNLEPLRALLRVDARIERAGVAPRRRVAAGRADAPLARTRLVVRAHALAGLGREDEATRVLHALRDDHGPHALARVVQLRGPASPLAARLAPAGPYR
ncbi:MAG: hypothetical protein RID93_46510, partial [Sandaracinaceae bacterium]